MLTKRDEDILKAVYFYRYVTAVDIAYLLFSPKSLTYGRAALSNLAGNADHKENQYLYRFSLPGGGSGNRERVYTLGARGRDFLQNELGMNVNWHFRPEKVRHLSHSHLLHHLLLTRFLVAVSYWSRNQSGYKLEQVRMGYDMPRLAVIPDAWAWVVRGKQNFPLMLEIDRGTEFREKFKKHVADRIAFVRSGEYEKLFGVKAVMIVYITTGDTESYRARRIGNMREWTMQVLREQNRENWAGVFRFAGLSLPQIYETPLFDEAIWYRPDEEKPVPLFSG